MTFAATYRDADGALREERLEASSRGECFAQMKARGIAPMSVKEGTPKGARKPTGRTGVPPVHGGDRIGRTPRAVTLPEEPTRSTALAKEVKPAAAPKPVPVEEVVPPQENPNKALRQELAKMTKEERMDYAFKEMQNRKIPLEPKTNRIFRTGIEASMARIFMTQLGDPPPPPFTTVVPLRDEAHLAEILIAHNPVLETDTEAQKASKEMVALAKKEMMDYIKNGGNPEDFLKYYHGKLKEAFEFRRESMKSLIQVSRDDPSITAEYLDRLNKELADKGIKQIELNEKQRKRLGLE